MIKKTLNFLFQTVYDSVFLIFIFRCLDTHTHTRYSTPHSLNINGKIAFGSLGDDFKSCQ